MRRGTRLVALCLSLLLIGLLIANLWSTLALHRALAAMPAPAEATVAPPPSSKQTMPNSDAPRDRLLAALHELLIEQGGNREWEAEKGRLLARYERLARTHKDLQLRDGSERDRITIAAISILAERSADRIEDTVRKALSNKGFSERIIQVACEHVHEQFVKHP